MKSNIRHSHGPDMAQSGFYSSQHNQGALYECFRMLADGDILGASVKLAEIDTQVAGALKASLNVDLLALQDSLEANIRGQQSVRNLVLAKQDKRSALLIIAPTLGVSAKTAKGMKNRTLESLLKNKARLSLAAK